MRRIFEATERYIDINRHFSSFLPETSQEERKRVIVQEILPKIVELLEQAKLEDRHSCIRDEVLLRVQWYLSDIMEMKKNGLISGKAFQKDEVKLSEALQSFSRMYKDQVQNSPRVQLQWIERFLREPDSLQTAEPQAAVAKDPAIVTPSTAVSYEGLTKLLGALCEPAAAPKMDYNRVSPGAVFGQVMSDFAQVAAQQPRPSVREPQSSGCLLVSDRQGKGMADVASNIQLLNVLEDRLGQGRLIKM